MLVQLLLRCLLTMFQEISLSYILLELVSLQCSRKSYVKLLSISKCISDVKCHLKVLKGTIQRPSCCILDLNDFCLLGLVYQLTKPRLDGMRMGIFSWDYCLPDVLLIVNMQEEELAFEVSRVIAQLPRWVEITFRHVKLFHEPAVLLIESITIRYQFILWIE